MAHGRLLVNISAEHEKFRNETDTKDTANEPIVAKHTSPVLNKTECESAV